MEAVNTRRVIARLHGEAKNRKEEKEEPFASKDKYQSKVIVLAKLSEGQWGASTPIWHLPIQRYSQLFFDRSPNELPVTDHHFSHHRQTKNFHPAVTEKRMKYRWDEH